MVAISTFQGNPQVHKTAVLLTCSFQIYLIYPKKVKLTIKNLEKNLKNTVFGEMFDCLWISKVYREDNI